MTTVTIPEGIEQQIREVLAGATDAFVLSDKLFTPQGLFNQLATSERDRRALTKSALFREALRRLSTLQKQEAAEFSAAVEQTRHGSNCVVKCERV